MTLTEFIIESNRIERILRAPTKAEIEAHVTLLSGAMTVSRLENFVGIIAPGKCLRRTLGMNVRVGNHRPPVGGPYVEALLEDILLHVGDAGADAYDVHQRYEALHPFMDGNGRSGRALWLWMMGGPEAAPLGFLHHWYYQSLDAQRSPR